MAKTSVKIKEPKVRYTTRQKKLLAEMMISYDNGESPTKGELMRRAGYPPSVVRTRTKDTFTAAGFRALCEANGLTGNRIREVVDDALQAKTVVTFQGDAKESDAPDHAIRLRAAEYLGKITGLQVDRVQNVNINIDAQEAATLLGLD